MISNVKELFELNEQIIKKEKVEIPTFDNEDAKFLWLKLLEVYNG